MVGDIGKANELPRFGRENPFSANLKFSAATHAAKYIFVFPSGTESHQEVSFTSKMSNKG